MKRFVLVLLIICPFAVYALPSSGVIYNGNGETNADNVESALNELYSGLNDKQNEINRINEIGNAQANQILNGVQAYVKGQTIVGTMADYRNSTRGFCGYENITVQSHPNDSKQALVTLDNQYGLEGYIGSGTKFQANIGNLNAENIRAGIIIGRNNGNSSNSIVGTFTNDATAVSNQILSGVTAYVKGNKVTGNISSRGAATITPGTSNQTINAGQYLSGNQTIVGDTDLVAGNIKKGINLFGVNGTYEPTVSNAGTSTITFGNYAAVDWQTQFNISAGKYIVTNTLETSGACTTQRCMMNFAPSACGYGNCSGVSVSRLSHTIVGNNSIEVYYVVLSSNKNAGTSMGRALNYLEGSSNTSAIKKGTSHWVKIS